MNNNTQNTKRIAKNTLLLYFRMLVLMLIALYTSRVVLQALGIDDFGVYNVVGGFVSMFTLLSGSLSTAISRFITVELGKGDEGKLKKIFSISLCIQALLSLIVVVVAETIGLWFLNSELNIPAERMVAANWCYQFSVLTFILSLISIPFNATIIAHERMSAFAYISILEAVCKLLIAWSILHSPIDRLIFYAILIAVVAGMVLLAYATYCLRSFSECSIRFHYDRSLLKEMSGFAGWNMIGSSSLILRNQGVDILLNMFFGVTVNAAKGLCNQVQNAVYQFVTNFQTAVNPQLTMSVARRDFQRTHTLIMQGGRFSFYLLSVLAVPLMVATPEVLSLWLVEVPVYTVEFIRFTLLYLLLDAQSRFLITSVQADGRIKVYQLVVGVIKLSTLPLVYVWLLLGGSPLTGILANIIIEVVCLCLRLYYNKKYNDLSCRSYLFKTVLPCWLIFAIAMIPSYSIRVLLTSNVFILVPLSIVVTFLVIIVVGLNRREQVMILKKAKALFGGKQDG